jgi:SAM-dependent methyltransferase
MINFQFICPVCRTSVQKIAEDRLQCPQDDLTFTRQAGVWCFLLPDRMKFFDAGRDGLERSAAAERREGFETLQNKVIVSLEQTRGSALKILDIGAGTGWLAEILAARGHQVAAVDVVATQAWRQRDGRIVSIQTEFDDLPLADEQFDLALFFNSLHFSQGYISTLAAALTALKPDGLLVIAASPVFRLKHRAMKSSSADDGILEFLDSERYLTYDWLDSLAEILTVEWDYYHQHNSVVRFTSALCGLPAYPLIVGRKAPPKPRPLPEEWL